MANGTLAVNAAEVDFYHYSGKRKGILSWLLTTDHKRIGLMYLGTMMLFFVTAMTLGVLMRLEMLQPENTIMKPQTYNSLFTLHGVIMIFLFIIPGIPAVFGNFFLPIQIGAKDVIFPAAKSSFLVPVYKRWCNCNYFFIHRRRGCRYRVDFLCSI